MQLQSETNRPIPSDNAFKRKRRIGGLTWVLIGIGVLFVAGLIVSVLRTQHGPTPRAVAAPAEVYFGVHEFIDVPEGGVTFNDVYPPGGPADKAGLVGGDIVTNFDGREIRHKGQMLDLLRQLQAGKTVDVVFVRDGESKKTTLTTISTEEFERLEQEFESRPEGHGAFGFEDTSTVPIEGTRISGVRLNTVGSSGPAALAGIEKGDVVIEFDGVPIRKRGELISRVRRAIPYSTVKVIVMRGSQRLEIPMKVGKR